MLELPRWWWAPTRRAVSGVPGCLPVVLAALWGGLFLPKYPWLASRRVSAGLSAAYLCCLTALTSVPGSGEFGLEVLLALSGIADGGAKSNCLEYLLFVAEVGGPRFAE